MGDRSALWWGLISILISLCLCSGSSSPVLGPHHSSTPLSWLPLAFIFVLLHPVLMAYLSIGLFAQTTTDPLTTPSHILSRLCQDYRTWLRCPWRLIHIRFSAKLYLICNLMLCTVTSSSGILAWYEYWFRYLLPIVYLSIYEMIRVTDGREESRWQSRKPRCKYHIWSVYHQEITSHAFLKFV